MRTNGIMSVMEHAFDHAYWEQHWQESGDRGPIHPYLAREVGDLSPGTALEAGCGTGGEAVWLATRGWRVTGVDIAERALDRAAERAAASGVSYRLTWIRADLSTWEPGATYDLVSTHYAHASIPQLDLYTRLATWVAPGGILLIVGHGGAAHPGEASVTATDVVERLGLKEWDIVTASEERRTVTQGHGGHELNDVVVRARRRG